MQFLALWARRAVSFFFSCEQVPFKQAHLKDTIHTFLKADNACLYNDFCMLHERLAQCCVHDTKCEVSVEGLFMIIVGYSCKGMSSLMNANREDVLAQCIGSSGSTCKALLDFLDKVKVPVGVLENVSEMSKSEDESKNVRFLNSNLRALGYEVMSKLLWTSDYYLPQKRKRSWTVIVHAGSLGLTSQQALDFLTVVFKMVVDLGVPHAELAKFLLPASHPAVKEELLRRELSTGDSGQGNFTKLHQDYMKAKGVTWRTLKPVPAVAASQWYHQLPSREQDIINFSMQFDSNIIAVDCSQRIDRAAITIGPCMHTITQGNKNFLISIRANSALLPPASVAAAPNLPAVYSLYHCGPFSLFSSFSQQSITL